jgi:hypothetical protein
MGGGTHDGVGGTQSFGEESIQPQPRIKQSLLLSRFYRTAPESALSEMFVFDHALRNPVLSTKHLVVGVVGPPALGLNTLTWVFGS